MAITRGTQVQGYWYTRGLHSRRGLHAAVPFLQTKVHHGEWEEASGISPWESWGKPSGDEPDDCWTHMLEYNPPNRSNSSCVPRSTTTPSLKTRIKSEMVHRMREFDHGHVRLHTPASTTVLSLCAIKILVRAWPLSRLLMLFINSNSVWASRADVCKMSGKVATQRRRHGLPPRQKKVSEDPSTKPWLPLTSASPLRKSLNPFRRR